MGRNDGKTAECSAFIRGMTTFTSMSGFTMWFTANLGLKYPAALKLGGSDCHETLPELEIVWRCTYHCFSIIASESYIDPCTAYSSRLDIIF
jgi:hypothetical protein